MTAPITTGRSKSRPIAWLATLLFVILAVSAAGPHPWDEQSSPAGSSIVRAFPACPLCDYTAYGALVAAPQPLIALQPRVLPPVEPVPIVSPRRSALQQPFGRAPPQPFV